MFQDQQFLSELHALPPEPSPPRALSVVEGRALKRKQASADKAPHPRFGSARGLISMSDDFDEPLEDFAE